MPAERKQQEQEIVGRIREGDRSAFEELYDDYSAALYGVVSKILRSEEAAQDVMQEAFVKIWKYIHSYDAKKGTLFTWMLNIARNAAIDALRKSSHSGKAKIQSLDPAVHMEGSGRTETSVQTIGMRDFVEKMPPEYRVIVEYLYFNGYTQKEVSEELDIPLGTVKTRARKALQELRKIFRLLVIWI